MLNYIQNICFGEIFKMGGTLYHFNEQTQNVGDIIGHCVVIIKNDPKLIIDLGNEQLHFPINDKIQLKTWIYHVSKYPVFSLFDKYVFNIESGNLKFKTILLKYVNFNENTAAQKYSNESENNILYSFNDGYKFQNFINIEIVQSGTYSYIFNITDISFNNLSSQKIKNDIHMQFYEKSREISWINNNNDLKIYFKNTISFKNFQKKFIECLYETNKQCPFNELIDKHKNWMHSEKEIESESSSDYEQVEDHKSIIQCYMNKMITATLSNKIFISSGSYIESFLNEQKYLISENLSFEPSQLVFNNCENNILLLNNKETTVIYNFDINTSNIIDKWNISSNIKQLNLNAKFKQQTDEKTFLGINSSKLIKFDSRLKNILISEKEFFSKKFLVISTTGCGNIVIGTLDGEIELYDNKHNFLLSFPGFGCPIIGIDTTFNGEWIVATCSTYLILINTFINGQSLFVNPSLDSFPEPIILQLNKQDIRTICNINFMPAKFNLNQEFEKYIVTSTGSRLVVWKFRKTRTNIIKKYKIQSLNDIIINFDFKYNDDTSIIVGTPTTIRTIDNFL